MPHSVDTPVSVRRESPPDQALVGDGLSAISRRLAHALAKRVLFVHDALTMRILKTEKGATEGAIALIVVAPSETKRLSSWWNGNAPPVSITTSILATLIGHVGRVSPGFEETPR